MFNIHEEALSQFRECKRQHRDFIIDQALMYDDLDLSLALDMYESNMTTEEVKSVLDTAKTAEVHKLAIRILNGRSTTKYSFTIHNK